MGDPLPILTKEWPKVRLGIFKLGKCQKFGGNFLTLIPQARINQQVKRRSGLTNININIFYHGWPNTNPPTTAAKRDARQAKVWLGVLEMGQGPLI